MARAYIVLARNDLDDSLLQVLDLQPNTSQLNPILSGQNSGQTGYQTFYLIDGVNLPITTAAGPPITTGVAADAYGLSAYLIDTIENQVGARAATAANAILASGDIEAAVAAGTALTSVEINVILAARIGAGSSLTAGNSTGTVEEILRILAGERYRVPAAAVLEDGVPNFIGARRGAFVVRPNVEDPASINGVYGDVRGRKFNSPVAYLRAGEPRALPVQTGLQDTNFNDVRQIVDAGDLHLSATNGVLADLKAATFAFENPAFTYGAAGTALTIGLGNILAGGAGRAVTVYDALGNVI